MTRSALIRRMQKRLPRSRILTDEGELSLYDSDGLTLHRSPPGAVLLLENAEEVVFAVTTLAEARTPFVPRGAGTGLSGGAVALDGAWILDLHRMRSIIAIDPLERTAVIEPGVINLDLDLAAAEHGLRFAPDPSSQKACTVGGNIAENSGGPHCFLHGMTTRHVLAIRGVLSDGSVISIGGGPGTAATIDWRGAWVGSEGTFGVTVEATVQLIPRPPAIRTALASFASLQDACQTVSTIIARGLRPAALEILDRLTIEAVEASVFRAGYPREAEAVLLIESEGLPGEVEEESKQVRQACESHGSIDHQEATDEANRERLWRGRKGAFGAMGRIATDLYVLDGVVPRKRLAEVIVKIQEIGARYQLVLSNVFHAGDGNLHPNISFDASDPQQKARVLAAGAEILKLCVDAGGTLSGEHGIGIEKRDQMHLIFDEEEMETQRLLRRAVDPENLANPGKILPGGRGCTEAGIRSQQYLDRAGEIL